MRETTGRGGHLGKHGALLCIRTVAVCSSLSASRAEQVEELNGKTQLVLCARLYGRPASVLSAEKTRLREMHSLPNALSSVGYGFLQNPEKNF